LVAIYLLPLCNDGIDLDWNLYSLRSSHRYQGQRLASRKAPSGGGGGAVGLLASSDQIRGGGGVNTKGRWASAAKASREHPAGVGGVDLPHSTKKGEAPEEESEEVTPPKPATAVVERESVDRSNKNPATLQPLVEEGSEEGSQEENPPERPAVVVVVAVSDKTKKNRALESPSTAARGEVSWSIVTSS